MLDVKQHEISTLCLNYQMATLITYSLFELSEGFCGFLFLVTRFRHPIVIRESSIF